MEPAETIVLPAAPVAPTRGSLPLVAAVVPMASGVVLFIVTGSPLSLCFAALGPVMILGSFLDALRQRRRAARLARAEETRAWERVEEVVAAREAEEVTRRWRATPDLATCLADPPARSIALAERVELVVGRGDGASPLRFSGSGERAEAFRARHGVVGALPVAVALSDGLCVRGPAPVAAAVARALVLQLCLRHAVGAFRLEGDAVGPLGLEELPHTRGGHPGARTVHLGIRRTVPEGPRLCILDPGSPVPAGYRAVLDVTDPCDARLRTPEGDRGCVAGAVSREQAEVLIRGLAHEEGSAAVIPAAVRIGDVLPPHAGGGGVAADPDASAELRAVFGRDAEGAVAVDLVADGPHALVTGVTGAGKSELLVSWVSALAAGHSADRLAFVLADFKGGTAFEPLRALPHVATIITDLDRSGAERGVRSLRAELRRREGVLAEHGARSVAEAGGALGRLVIVVDEFAALLQEHPDLAAVFTDIAARGRALGMHLILGTQRATGVIRDALAANCPLRIALRVTDPGDSRAMIGTDDAARLPGDLAGRGLAYVRRAQDTAPAAFRVARTGPDEIATIADRWLGARRARSPWLPALRPRLQRAELPAVAAGEILLGLADEPDQQRQFARTLREGERGLAVFGGPGSGKSSVLRGAVQQVPGALLLSGDPEQLWSLVDEMAEDRRPLPRLLAVDDVDRQLAAFGLEYAAAWMERLQRVLRMAAERQTTVMLSSSRCTGQIAVLADLLPARALLRSASRTEYLAAGGDPRSYDPDRPPGRGLLDGVEVQFALPDEAGAAESRSARAVGDEGTALWQPRASLIGVVSPAPARTAEQLAARFGRGAVHVVSDASSATLAEDARTAGELQVMVGDADAWQRQYALWQRIARTGEMVVLAEAGRELRTLAGVRELPPYARMHAGRAWTVGDDGRPSRVILSAPQEGISSAARPAA